MKRFLAAAAAILVLPAALYALATESFGNAPVVKQPGWADGVLEVINLKSRVYQRWVNGNESFYFRGGAAELNEAVAKYAAVKADSRQLILVVGDGKTQSFGRGEVAYDWHLHVPSGIYRAMTGNKHAVLTVHINAAKPRGKVDRNQAEKWIAQLDDESFEVREKAEKGLRELGRDVKPLLQAALKAGPSLEPRRRIDRLLKALPGIDVSDLQVPKGITVVVPSELLASHLKGLEDSNEYACAQAIHGLGELVPFSDKAVPALVGMLKKDKKEYVRRVAASTLAQLGAAAKSALPALKEGLEDADANVRAAFADAVQRIEKARAAPEKEDEVKRKQRIFDELNAVKKPGAK